MKPTKEANEIKRRVARMLDRLAFSPENVVAAAVETPVMFRDAVEYRKLCLFERNQAKARYERAAADVALKLRKAARDCGDRTTEGEISARVASNLKLIPFVSARDRAEEAEEYSRLVVDTIRVRRTCLEMIAQLVREEISIQSAVEGNRGKLDDLQRKLSARYPGDELSTARWMEDS